MTEAMIILWHCAARRAVAKYRPSSHESCSSRAVTPGSMSLPSDLHHVVAKFNDLQLESYCFDHCCCHSAYKIGTAGTGGGDNTLNPHRILQQACTRRRARGRARARRHDARVGARVVPALGGLDGPDARSGLVLLLR